MYWLERIRIDSFVKGASMISKLDMILIWLMTGWLALFETDIKRMGEFSLMLFLGCTFVLLKWVWYWIAKREE
jgi:hypothetical protein